MKTEKEDDGYIQHLEKRLLGAIEYMGFAISEYGADSLTALNARDTVRFQLNQVRIAKNTRSPSWN